MKLTNFPDGSDLTLMNTIYEKPKKDENTGKWSKDNITLIFKDNVSGKKSMSYIEDPDYVYYKIKPNIDASYTRLYINKNDVDECITSYRNIEKDIAERTQNLDFYYDNMRCGNRNANKMLHQIPSILGSDMNIQDHYRSLFGRVYKNSIKPITKSYLDIEVDGRYAAGDFPQLGECPINAVTIIDDKTKTINTFLLRDPKNPLIDEFENDVKSGKIFKELDYFIWNHIVNSDPSNSKKMQTLYDAVGISDYEVIFNFYDLEIVLIAALFELINKVQPDFLLA